MTLEIGAIMADYIHVIVIISIKEYNFAINVPITAITIVCGMTK